MSNGDFYRPKSRVIGGVCAGIANSLNIDSLWVRLAFVILTILTAGIIGIIVYAVLWMVMPEG